MRTCLFALACACAATRLAAQPALPAAHPHAPPELARPPFLAPAAAGSFTLPPLDSPRHAEPPTPGAGAPLRMLHFRGNTVISGDELLQVAQPWLGQPVDAASLEALRIALTRHYVDRGYVNSGARLDPAGVSNGVLAVEIVEGRLAGIRFSGLDGLDEAYVTARLWPDAQRPLHLNELRERYQLLLDDPLIRRMNARLLPDGNPGGATLDVAVERAQPWWATVRFNNHRPASVGEQSAGLEAGIRNLTGRGDVLRGDLQPDLRDGGLARFGLAWTVPVRHPGTSLTLQYDDSDSSVVEEPLAAADIRSRLQTFEAGLGQVLVDNLRLRAAVGVAWREQHSRTWLAGERFPFVAGVPEGGLRNRSLRLWQEVTWRSQDQVFAARSTFVQSRNNLQPLPEPALVQPGPRRTGFWLGQAQYARRLGDTGWQAIARGTVQATSDRLVALDALSIGGAGTVRGWRENQLVRDRGAIVNLELDVPLWRSSANGSSLHLLPFVDYGRGRNQGQAADTIGSVGVAARWKRGPWSADAAWGWRAWSTAPKAKAGHSWQDHGVHLQVSYALGR